MLEVSCISYLQVIDAHFLISCSRDEIVRTGTKQDWKDRVAQDVLASIAFIDRFLALDHEFWKHSQSQQHRPPLLRLFVMRISSTPPSGKNIR